MERSRTFRVIRTRFTYGLTDAVVHTVIMPKRRGSIDALIDAHVWLSRNAARLDDLDAAASLESEQDRVLKRSAKDLALKPHALTRTKSTGNPT